MFRCPYCEAPMAHPEPEHIAMSQKRRQIFDYVVKTGPKGVSKKEVIAKFFGACKSETVLRTTIFYINQAIRPIQIHSRGGVLRITRPE